MPSSPTLRFKRLISSSPSASFFFARARKGILGAMRKAVASLFHLGHFQAVPAGGLSRHGLTF
jgi:hypothetical protein